jgi:hypothetical protein
VAPLGDGSWNVLDATKLAGFSGITTNFRESVVLTLGGLKAFSHKGLDERARANEIQKWGLKQLKTPVLRREESLNLINIQNCLKGFREDGLFQTSADGGGLEILHSAWREYNTEFRRLLGCENE